jgi:hypothetical protein
VRVLDSVKSYHASRGVQVLELSRVIVQTKGVGVLESVKGYCALGFFHMIFRLRVHHVIVRIVIWWFITVKDWDNNPVRCIYLYIVVSPYVRGLSAYVYLYMYYILWPLAPW